MPSARLIYCNSTPEIMAWSEDVHERERTILAARLEWMKGIYDAAGVPDPEVYDKHIRSAWVNDGRMAGLSWPRDMDDKLPDGWFRPVKDPHLVRPRGSNKKTLAEMRKYDRPDQRHELEVRFGMHGRSFAGLGLYSCGIQHEQDGVWVTWASKDIAKEKWAQNLAEHGWVQVPLVDFINRFGEDAL